MTRKRLIIGIALLGIALTFGGNAWAGQDQGGKPDALILGAIDIHPLRASSGGSLIGGFELMIAIKPGFGREPQPQYGLTDVGEDVQFVFFRMKHAVKHPCKAISECVGYHRGFLYVGKFVLDFTQRTFPYLLDVGCR